MANRRKFIAGLGALATGSAAAAGTGAFTSVTADRGVSVTVTGDANAYLGVSASSSTNGVYADESGDDGELSIDFGDISGASRDNNVTTGGSGVNPDAVTIAEDVFRVTNQGPQAVEVDLSDGGNGNTQINTSDPSTPTSGSNEVYIYFNTSATATSISGNNYFDANDVELDPGDVVQVDVIITTGSSFPTLNDITLEATAGDADNNAED